MAASAARIAPGEVKLSTLLRAVKGVKEKEADGLERLGVRTVGELIKHIPMRYERIESETPIAQLKEGTIGSARGEVIGTKISGPRFPTKASRVRFQAAVADHTGRLDLVWFNQPYMRDRVLPGMRVRVTGPVKRFGVGLQITNPKLEVIKEGEEGAAGGSAAGANGRGASAGSGDAAEKAAGGGEFATLRPVYPASETINSAAIGRIVESVLDAALAQIEDHLPPEFRKAKSLPNLADAYRMAHAPGTEWEASEARRRLAYDELLLLQLGVYMRRAQVRESTVAPPLKWSPKIDEHIRARFPFTLTEQQSAAVEEIAKDLQKPSPANRLIQGDVGAGKTVVALYAMLMSVAAGKQAALMAPTELLAEQHAVSIARMLEGSKVVTTLLTGSVTGRTREDKVHAIATGGVDIVIGTHALLSERVEFNDLAVVVIDEQHRFGVHQRAGLRQKGRGTDRGSARSVRGPDDSTIEATSPGRKGTSTERSESGTDRSAPQPRSAARPARRTSPSTDSSPEREESVAQRAVMPHIIVMTATPIPRTLALTLFGDLDVTTIRGLPPGRQEVVTKLVRPDASGDVYNWVRTRIEAGEQAFVVVPAIDTGASSAGRGGDLELNDLRTVHDRLRGGELAGKRIAALHGRLSSEKREEIMGRFRAGDIDCLVATTVIEVGVDVPSATVMVIEHAEMFGLSQLHQLRGRIGRGSKRGVCVLISDATKTVTGDADARLKVMVETTDGFAIAERDLEIRGPGEFFGMRQAGAPPLQVADLMLDRELLNMARRDAREWIERSPRLEAPEEKVLRQRLMRKHGQWLGLGDVG